MTSPIDEYNPLLRPDLQRPTLRQRLARVVMRVAAWIGGRDA